MAGNYEKTLAARKLINVKDTHSNRHLYGRTTQILAQIEKLWRRRLCSSLERIIEAKFTKATNPHCPLPWPLPPSLPSPSPLSPPPPLPSPPPMPMPPPPPLPADPHRHCHCLCQCYRPCHRYCHHHHHKS